MFALTIKESLPLDVGKAPSPAGPAPMRRANPSRPIAAIPGPASPRILIDLAMAQGVRRGFPMSGGDGPWTAWAIVSGRHVWPGRFQPAPGGTGKPIGDKPAAPMGSTALPRGDACRLGEAGQCPLGAPARAMVGP